MFFSPKRLLNRLFLFLKPVELTQGPSLARKLEQKGIQHGDIAHGVEIEGIGIETTQDGQVLVAFCPSEILNVVVLHKSKKAKNRNPRVLSHFVTASVKNQREFRKLVYERGFAHIQCDVHCNGSLTLSRIKFFAFTPVAKGVGVTGAKAYQEFKRTTEPDLQPVT